MIYKLVSFTNINYKSYNIHGLVNINLIYIKDIWKRSKTRGIWMDAYYTAGLLGLISSYLLFYGPISGLTTKSSKCLRILRNRT